MFVVEVEQLACLAGVSPLVLSLILAPVATELPEKFNSVIWVGRGKDTLALGNITGAMVFQCSFPVAIGIVWTPWNLLENKGVTFSSGVLALSSALGVLAWVRLRGTLPRWVLMMGGVFYAAFIAFVLIHVR
jgi:cation:H+ antiporter